MRFKDWEINSSRTKEQERIKEANSMIIRFGRGIMRGKDLTRESKAQRQNKKQVKIFNIDYIFNGPDVTVGATE